MPSSLIAAPNCRPSTAGTSGVGTDDQTPLCCLLIYSPSLLAVVFRIAKSKAWTRCRLPVTVHLSSPESCPEAKCQAFMALVEKSGG